MKKYINTLFILLVVILFSACSSVTSRALSLEDINKLVNDKSQLQMRQLQTKRFYNTNKTELMKVIINSMQDELYFITFVNYDTGIISATAKKNDLDLNLVITIKEKKHNNLDLRISLSMVEENKISIINDEEIYTYLFDRLRKSLFLEQQLNKKINSETIKINQHTKLINNEKYGNKYSIQLISAKNKQYAKEYYQRANKYSNVRIQKLAKYYVVRVGRFNYFSKAEIMLKSLRKEFKDAIILKI